MINGIGKNMNKVSEESLEFIRKGDNRKRLWKEFASGKTKEDEPFTYFMAGAPGSGKTEIVKNHFVDVFKNCVFADADEIRNFLPQYNGKNSHEVQKAASKGIDILYDGALKEGCNILIDGTFALDHHKCEENISRSLKRGRSVVIFYLYTNPRVAWTYAKEREYTEGRKIKMKTFIRAFYKSRENINKIKQKFGSEVYAVGMKSNYHKGIKEIKVDIQNVDEIQKVGYTRFSLWLRVLYANMLLKKERIIWILKKVLKK